MHHHNKLLKRSVLILALYLSIQLPVAAAIWQPAPGTSWQWQLDGEIDTSFNVQMYDIDLFEVDASVIAALQASGKKVICYFSAGSFEIGRPDSGSFDSSMIGNQLVDYDDEFWLDITNPDLKPIMRYRLDLAVEKGCDGVEPDNVDGYDNNPGFNFNANDQLAYNRWLASEAHARNLSVGLKNDLDQVAALVNDFDWALNEQCYQYNECDLLMPFINEGKAVFGVEYIEEEGNPDVYCPDAINRRFSWLQKTYALTAEVITDCSTYATAVPYDRLRFQSVLNESKLQAPASNTAVDYGAFDGYSSGFFYLSNDDLMTFRMSGASARSELRQQKEWKTSDTGGNTLYGRVKLSFPQSSTLDQFTWMQVHDKPERVSGSPNKPLVRLAWRRSRGSINDHIWAAVYFSLNENPEWIDLGERPEGLFEARISIQSNDLKITINGNETIRNVSFWENFYNYFKAGVYLQSEGEAIVQFDQLYYGTGTSVFTWDIDGDGEVTALTDSLLYLRHLFGFTGTTLIDQAIGSNATRTTANEIESYLENASNAGDIDGDGTTAALTDGVLLLRFLLGFRGDSLIQGAVGRHAIRQSAAEIANYIGNYMP